MATLKELPFPAFMDEERSHRHYLPGLPIYYDDRDPKKLLHNDVLPTDGSQPTDPMVAMILERLKGLQEQQGGGDYGATDYPTILPGRYEPAQAPAAASRQAAAETPTEAGISRIIAGNQLAQPPSYFEENQRFNQLVGAGVPEPEAKKAVLDYQLQKEYLDSLSQRGRREGGANQAEIAGTLALLRENLKQSAMTGRQGTDIQARAEAATQRQLADAAKWRATLRGNLTREEIEQVGLYAAQMQTDPYGGTKTPAHTSDEVDLYADRLAKMRAGAMDEAGLPVPEKGTPSAGPKKQAPTIKPEVEKTYMDFLAPRLSPGISDEIWIDQLMLKGFSRDQAEELLKKAYEKKLGAASGK